MANETEELNYDDYTHDFMGKVGNIQDFSRTSSSALARVFRGHPELRPLCPCHDIQPEGRHQCRDGCGRRGVPGRHAAGDADGRFITLRGDWKNAQYQAIPFDVQTEDLTKEGLIRLIKTYWDQYLKGHNYFIDQWTKIIPEEDVWLGLPDMYQLIIDYEYPKLAKVFKIEPVHVVDFLKLATPEHRRHAGLRR